jgi:hypothetical protein
MAENLADAAGIPRRIPRQGIEAWTAAAEGCGYGNGSSLTLTLAANVVR